MSIGLKDAIAFLRSLTQEISILTMRNLKIHITKFYTDMIKIANYILRKRKITL